MASLGGGAMRRAPRVLRPDRLALGLWAATAVAAACGADAPPAARWVAADALAYVEVLRPEALIDRALSPEVRELLKAIPGLGEQLGKKEVKDLAAVADFVATSLETTAEQAVRDLTAGGIVLAVEGESGPERVVLVVTPRDPAFLERAHAKLVELARSDARTKGNPNPVKTAEHRGVTAYSVGPQEAHALLEGSLVVANGGEALKAVIDRVRGESKVTPISEAEEWRSRRSSLGPDAVAFAFARLEALRKIDPERFGTEKPDGGATFLLGAWYETARKAPWVAACLGLEGDRLSAEVVLPRPADGLDGPLRAFLPGPGRGAAQAVEVPGAILSVSLWRDLSAVWEVRDQILPPETLQGLAQLDSFAGQFFGGRDFGTGVLGALRSDWRLVVANQDYDAMDPKPDTKYPGFALLVGLDPDDREFSVRLQAAFQTFIGLVNLGAAQQKAPPLMLGSEQFEGVTISRGAYLAVEAPARDESRPGKGKADAKSYDAAGQRFNFSPSAAEVEHTFILSSNVALARALITSLRSERAAPASDATLVAEADGAQLARLVEVNRESLATQNMLQKGNARAAAEAEVDLLARLLRYLGHGRFTVHDGPDASRFAVEFRLQAR